jgi:hypothetical protein
LIVIDPGAEEPKLAAKVYPEYPLGEETGMKYLCAMAGKIGPMVPPRRL